MSLSPLPPLLGRPPARAPREHHAPAWNSSYSGSLGFLGVESSDRQLCFPWESLDTVKTRKQALLHQEHNGASTPRGTASGSLPGQQNSPERSCLQLRGVD